MFWINVNCIFAIGCAWQTFRLLNLVEQKLREAGYVRQDGTEWSCHVKIWALVLVCFFPVINALMFSLLWATNRSEEMFEELIPMMVEACDLKKKN